MNVVHAVHGKVVNDFNCVAKEGILKVERVKLYDQKDALLEDGVKTVLLACGRLN